MSTMVRPRHRMRNGRIPPLWRDPAVVVAAPGPREAVTRPQLRIGICMGYL